MSLKRNNNQGQSVGSTKRTKNQDFNKRVVDIVLNSSHKGYNSEDDIGTIYFVDIGFNQDYTDSTLLPSAKPYSRNNFTYPVVGEIVQIIEGPSNDIYSDIGGDINTKTLYYTPAINTHNNTTSNALPLEKDTKSNRPKTESNVKAFEFRKEFKNTSREIASRELDNYLRDFGYTSGRSDARAPKYNLVQAANGDYIFRLEDSKDNRNAAIKLGKYFKENPELRPLKPGEGDSIMEGKNGQRIRFTTTGPTGTNAISNNVTETPDDGNPSIGDKAMVLSLGNDVQENVTKDAASIYMLENQSIPIDATSNNIDSLNSEYVPLSDPLQEISKPPTAVIPQSSPEQDLVIQDIQFDFSGTSATNDSSAAQAVSTTDPVVEEDPVFAALDEAQSEGLINFDDEEFEIAGSELDDEGYGESNAGGDLNSGEDSEFGGSDPETNAEYEVPENDGDPIVFSNNKQFKNWKRRGRGKRDYPLKFKFNKTHGTKEVLVDPQPISKMIEKLRADGVNSSKLPHIKHLVCHVTATNYTNQHDLMALFAYTKDGKGWSRHGYNISVDDEGGCNYNVDLIKYGFSNGSGGNVYDKDTIQGFGPLKNSNSINISWIGTVKKSLARQDLVNEKGKSFTSKTTTGPGITAKQAYAYEKLIKYFVDAFPDIKVVGHNQITISGGYGKSCPGWNNVRFCKLIGIPDKNIHSIYPNNFTATDWNNIIKPRLNSKGQTDTINNIEKRANKDDGKYFQNFKSYNSGKYNETADYLYFLTRPSENYSA